MDITTTYLMCILCFFVGDCAGALASVYGMSRSNL